MLQLIINHYLSHPLQAVIVLGQAVLAISILITLALLRIRLPRSYWPALRIGICVSFLTGLAWCGEAGLFWAQSPLLPPADTISYHTICWFGVFLLASMLIRFEKTHPLAIYAGAFVCLLIPDLIFGLRYAAALGASPDLYPFVIAVGVGGGKLLDALFLVPIGLAITWAILNHLADHDLQRRLS